MILQWQFLCWLPEWSTVKRELGTAHCLFKLTPLRFKCATKFKAITNMKVVIIEDETPAASRLIKLLHKTDDAIEIIARLDSVESSVKFFLSTPAIDLVFM